MFGSSPRTSRPGPRGPPSPPSPLSHAVGEGEHVIRGEPSSPRVPGLPQRGRFRTGASPCQAVMGEGDKMTQENPRSP